MKSDKVGAVRSARVQTASPFSGDQSPDWGERGRNLPTTGATTPPSQLQAGKERRASSASTPQVDGGEEEFMFELANRPPPPPFRITSLLDARQRWVQLLQQKINKYSPAHVSQMTSDRFG